MGNSQLKGNFSLLLLLVDCVLSIGWSLAYLYIFDEVVPVDYLGTHLSCMILSWPRKQPQKVKWVLLVTSTCFLFHSLWFTTSFLAVRCRLKVMGHLVLVRRHMAHYMLHIGLGWTTLGWIYRAESNSSILFTILQVEGSVVHIMKALARHPGAAQTLAESDRLQLMFHMVVMGGTMPPPSKSQSFKRELESAPPLHLAQLYRHVLQVGAALQV